MYLSSVWKSRKAGKKKSAHKPKIRWQLLGLTDPDSVDNISSIEVIRQEVASLARYSFGEDTRLRSIVQESKPLKRRHKLVGARNKHSGAIE
jgi:hypothetical protein